MTHVHARHYDSLRVLEQSSQVAHWTFCLFIMRIRWVNETWISLVSIIQVESLDSVKPGAILGEITLMSGLRKAFCYHHRFTILKGSEAFGHMATNNDIISLWDSSAWKHGRRLLSFLWCPSYIDPCPYNSKPLANSGLSLISVLVVSWRYTVRRQEQPGITWTSGRRIIWQNASKNQGVRVRYIGFIFIDWNVLDIVLMPAWMVRMKKGSRRSQGNIRRSRSQIGLLLTRVSNMYVFL